MLKRLLFAALLLVSAAVYGVNSTAPLTAQLVPAGSAPPIPAGAQAAGFTTLAFETDFTKPMPSNWLDCYPQTDDPNAKWYQGYWYRQDQPPCTRGDGGSGSWINIVTDPVYRNQALDMTWKWAASPVVDQGYTELQTHSWDGTVGTSFPIFNRYEEIVFRVVTTPDTPNVTPRGQSNPWAEVGGTFWGAYSWNLSSAGAHRTNPNPMEQDLIENHGDYPWYQTGGGCINHLPGGAQFCNRYAGLPQPYDPRVYHTAGFRVTSDGTTAAACGYVDGVFKTCGTIPGVTANQFTDRQFGILINGIGCNYSAGDNTCQNAVIQDVHGCTDGSGAICITAISAPGTWNAGKLFVEPTAGAYVRITGVTGVTQANGVWTVNLTNSNTNEWRLNNSTWPGSGAVAQTAAVFNNFAQTDMYVKSYRVWSCANWKTTQCNGPVLTTSP